MTPIRYLVLALCVSAAGLSLGCHDRSSSDLREPPTIDASTSGAETDESPAVTVTPTAAATIRQVLANQPASAQFCLRVRVVPGGCQGYMHKLDLDPETTAEDYVCKSEGVRVVLFKRQLGMIRGSQVDYGEEDGKTGFKIDNPNFKGESARKWLELLEGEKDTK